MRSGILRTAAGALASAAVAIVWVAAAGCSTRDEPQAAPAEAAPGRTRTLSRSLTAPEAPRLMQLYFNLEDQREWIYDGAQWVPHDKRVADYYPQAAKAVVPLSGPGSTALADPACLPTGAHPKHRAHACTTCHLGAGTPCLDPAGEAAATGRPAPGFDLASKTCSSVACHGAYSGTFTYTRWNWDLDDYEYVTVPYLGTGGAAPSWYARGTTCASCHGNPPTTTFWHSPSHAPWISATRRCETCHPDAVSGVEGGKTVGVAIKASSAALHGNGSVDVQAQFTWQCFGCH